MVHAVLFGGQYVHQSLEHANRATADRRAAARDERSLAHVLLVVVDDADQPDAEGDGRVPPLVDDPAEVVSAEG